MNRTKLKTYAPQARRDFIQAVTDRAAFYGLTEKKIEPITENGDVAIIGGRAFPRAIASKRKALEERIAQYGFGQTMDAIAYTWFNRLVAIRYMELHGYLDHGYRVLSHPDASKSIPEILEQAEHLALPGLDKHKVIELKLEGSKEPELYRILLLAQCNTLYKTMPFLFEWIGDETELLLPDNLLHTDSLIRNLVGEIDESDWQEVEIIGWLYQFYISERKDEVIGKVVASEDIPAATQLFTPNWIVKYLVQNTLGRQWLATYPQSALRQQMEYYIEPAEQTPEVQEQLKAITPTRLDPEELTLLDPACGSGHILVEAYDLFKAIYQERGYRAKDIPALILQKNLFGLEIDDRAAQLAAFALMMKARADDRRIFDGEATPNVVSIQDSEGLNAADITHALNSPINNEDIPKEYLFEEIQEEKDGLFSKKALAEKGHVSQADIAYLLELFENAKTFGALIQIPTKLAGKLPEIEERLDDVLTFGDLTHASAHVLKPLLQQARLLARQYDAVVANPPYMGGKYFAGKLKDFIAEEYKEAKADLYACFIQRNLVFVKPNGFVGMITIPNWMFLSSFEAVRQRLFDKHAIETFLHNGRGVFGADFGSCSFTLRNSLMPTYKGTFRRLFDKGSIVASNEELQQEFFRNESYFAAPADFAQIPGEPVAYWVNPSIRKAFADFPPMSSVADARQGLATSDNGRFLRFWFEVSHSKIAFGSQSRKDAIQSGCKWFPYNKGGEFRRWFGNHEYVLNWANEGSELASFDRAVVRNPDYYFRDGVTWSDVTISETSARELPKGFICDSTGHTAYCNNEREKHVVLCQLNSRVFSELIRIINPTVHFHVGYFNKLPYCNIGAAASEIALAAIEISRVDWNSAETSWGFMSLPLIRHQSTLVSQSLRATDEEHLERRRSMKAVEERNNTLLIAAYRLDGLSPEVPDDQITLYQPDREEDIKRLLSYAVGCMMGRYSLDKPGLIYAHSRNQGFDPSQYKTFRADDDGIIPLLETDWDIRDDATNRLVEFVGVAWQKEHLEGNLKFVADSLGPNNDEQPRDTIRRYLTTGFYKHHLSRYKKRPIYWLFSSGKQRVFQCLIYLHRYHEGTLARMRTEYVIPLQGKMTARLEQLSSEIEKASSSSQRKSLEKKRDLFLKQQTELRAFDEKLRHYTDQRITLDLDDGVKVNYGKFGDLLAEVKAVTGGSDED